MAAVWRARAQQFAAVVVASLVAARAELLTALTFVAGWLLITAGVAALTSAVAWYFSLGLLAISLGGWKVLWRLALDGLYALTRANADG